MNVRLAFAVALLLVPHGTHAQPRASRAAAAVTAFYRVHLPEVQSGLLDAGELQRRRPFLSRRLHQLYADAIRRRQDWIHRHAGEPSRAGRPRVALKPPCVDGGDYFDSLFEWPDVKSATDDPSRMFKVARVEAARRNEAWRVDVRFWYDTTPRVEWTDTLIVVEEGEEFVIDDVLYAEGLFNRGGSLSELLRNCARD